MINQLKYASVEFWHGTVLIDRYSWLSLPGLVCVAGPRPKVSDTDQGGRMEG